jgi:ribonuclease BN (tRNA processing enzyme)
VKIKVYGSRGSMPLSRKANAFYGGNTSCIKIDTRGRTIIADCGSGIIEYLNETAPNGEPLVLDILISHLHIDHLIGLSMFRPLLETGHDIKIHTVSRADEPLGTQVLGLFKPPYWPVNLERLNKAEFAEIINDKPFMIGGVKITSYASNHPDDTVAFRIEGDKVLVHFIDYEQETDLDYARTSGICKDADCIIYDSAYMPEDYIKKRGWGHSTYRHGIELAREVQCKNIIFSHFDHKYTDDELNKAVDEVRAAAPEITCYMAYDGMEVEI